MTINYERLENLVSRFNWDPEDQYGSQLVWSAIRNPVDPEFYFDCVLRNCGHEVEFNNIFLGCYLAITIGDWLYVGDKFDLERCSETVLLYRIRWNRLKIVDVENEVAKVEITKTDTEEF